MDSKVGHEKDFSLRCLLYTEKNYFSCD